MSDKKYSVFISSTYEDLKDERTAVLRAILQHGHFPLGMELWGAADEQQWQIIQRQIDVADYYVVIVAHRYGSLSDTGVSWTEREYDYAVEKGVPVLGFVQKGGSWPTEFVDKSENAECIERFRAKVRTKPVSFWSNSDQLRTEVVLALGKQIQSTPRIGWIRGSEAVTANVSNELARLSDENSVLREQLEASLDGAEMPDVALEVTNSWVRVEGTGQLEVNVRVGIDFVATLRKGRPPGFVSEGCSLSLMVGSHELKFEPSLSVSEPLVVDGPTLFTLYGALRTAPNIEIDQSTVTLKGVLRPIGYSNCYSTTVQAYLSRDDHAIALWVLKNPVVTPT